MSILRIKDQNGNIQDVLALVGADGKSAYEAAKEGGFTGTEEEFNKKLATDLLTIDDVPYTYSKGLTFTSNGDGTCKVTSGAMCNSDYVVIPRVSPEGDKVTSISRGAFNDDAGNLSFAIVVIVPDTVKFIDERAFASCFDLTAVVIDCNYSLDISGSAFVECPNLTIYLSTATSGSDWGGNWNGGYPVVYNAVTNVPQTLAKVSSIEARLAALEASSGSLADLSTEVF